MTTDFLLVQKIRNGDNQVSNLLVEKYYSSIYQYCFLHAHNQEYAEDIVQETLVRFWGALMSGADSPFKNATNREHSTGGGNTGGCISSVFRRKSR